MNRKMGMTAPHMLSLVALAVVVLALTGCDALQGSGSQALPTVMLDGGAAAPANTTSTAQPPQGGRPLAGEVSASGVVAPSQEAQLAFALAGQIESLDVQSGEAVQEGQVLARLAGSQRLSAAIAAANLELMASQQALADLRASADQARAGAQLRVANAKDALDEAEKRRSGKAYRVGSDSQVDLARADLILAEDQLKRTMEIYGGTASSDGNEVNKAAAISAIAAAEKARDRALANLNYLLSMPDEIEVEKADAELDVARAELAAAEAELARWQEGPDPEQVALVEARIDNAQAQLAAAQVALSDLELRAPFAGTVTEVLLHSGEWALPGQPSLRLADLDPLRVKVTDLSERDVPRIAVGQPVTVYVTALNQEVSGQVREISLLADRLGGDVVYPTWIVLDTALPELRAGMSVDITFR